MILLEAAWQRRPGLDRLVGSLGAANGQCRYVGGAVRDTLLGLPVADLDIATALRPDAVMAHLKAAGIRVVPTGLAHGTVTAVLADGPVEVTTLRRDVATDGRHAVVAFTDDWRADAARRDFTINALSADPTNGIVHDYFGGVDDLASRRVRFIGEATARIAEDHLRILRFFRFHARFGVDAPDPAGLAACTARANDLMTLSRERIAQELLKLLGATNPVPTVRIMIEHGIFAPILPEIDRDGADRLAHLVERERAHGAADPVRRLAALLPPRAGTVEAVALRLKLSNLQRRRLVFAAEPRLPTDARVLCYAFGMEAARDQLLLHGAADTVEPQLATLRDWSPPRLPIGGGELVGMGLTRGPIVAKTLQAIERRWIEEGFPDAARVFVLAAEEVAQALPDRK